MRTLILAITIATTLIACSTGGNPQIDDSGTGTGTDTSVSTDARVSATIGDRTDLAIPLYVDGFRLEDDNHNPAVTDGQCVDALVNDNGEASHTITAGDPTVTTLDGSMTVYTDGGSKWASWTVTTPLASSECHVPAAKLAHRFYAGEVKDWTWTESGPTGCNLLNSQGPLGYSTDGKQVFVTTGNTGGVMTLAFKNDMEMTYSDSHQTIDVQFTSDKLATGTVTYSTGLACDLTGEVSK